MSSAPVLCSVEAEAFGAPPRRSRIEARKLPQGFEVWFWDERTCPDGQRLAQRGGLYSARAFAEVMLGLKIDRRLCSDPDLAVAPYAPRSATTVTGEQGLSAELLRCAYTMGSRDIDWLMTQSDASFEFLATLFSDPPDDDWERQYLVAEIVPSAHELGYDEDYLDLLRRYGLPADAAGVRGLGAAIFADAERLRQDRRAKREARIAPFRPAIEAVATQYRDTPSYGGGRMWPSLRERMRMGLEQYVLDHGRLPEGTTRTFYKIRTNSMIWDMVMDEQDFAVLRRFAPRQD